MESLTPEGSTEEEEVLMSPSAPVVAVSGSLRKIFLPLPSKINYQLPFPIEKLTENQPLDEFLPSVNRKSVSLGRPTEEEETIISSSVANHLQGDSPRRDQLGCPPLLAVSSASKLNCFPSLPPTTDEAAHHH